MSPDSDTPAKTPRLKVLHVGNIANNAYNNAKIQRRLGLEADVICFDYYHIMGCPEWEDSGFVGTIRDPFKPDWWSVDLQGFRRPDWFAQGPVDQCRNYLKARNNNSVTEKYWHTRMTFSRWLLVSNYANYANYANQAGQASYAGIRKNLARLFQLLRSSISIIYWGPRNIAVFVFRNILPMWKKARNSQVRETYFVIRKIWRVLRYTIFTSALKSIKNSISQLLLMLAVTAISLGGALAYSLLSILKLTKLISADHSVEIQTEVDTLKTRLMRRLTKEIKNTAKRTADQSRRALNPVLREDAQQYLSDLDQWQSLFSQYDVIQAYSVDPIRPYLLNIPNFTAYEHGTIREIPFLDNALGRLTKASYQAAPIVFVTNSDNIAAVKKMNLEASRVVYLPHAFDETKLLRFKEQNTTQSTLGIDKVTLFSPSRQHWRDDNLSMSKRNDKFIRAFACVAKSDTRLFAKMVAWGEDLKKSRALIRELGVEDRVSWIEPLKKRELWMAYLQCHAVVDQFLIPAIGGVAFEAMTLGKRVLTSIDVEQTREFFGTPPVMFHCSNQSEIEERIRQVLADPSDLQCIGESATQWMIKYHSSQRVFDLQLKAYEQIL